MNKYVNSQLKNSTKLNNRNVVAAICINTFQELMKQTELVQDRVMLEKHIRFLKEQIE